MNVICYGDSNTWGYDPRGYFGGRYEEPWPEILREITGWKILNQGMNSREIPKFPVIFPADTDLLILMLGTNDLLQGNAPQTAADKMESFLKGLDLSFSRLLLIAPPSMCPGQWVPTQSLMEASKELNAYYETLSKRLGIGFANADAWSIPLAFDGVHVTEQGHRLFAQQLADYFTKEGILPCFRKK